MARAAPLADLLELRLDGIACPDLHALLADRPRPVIVTNRPVAEGGRYAGPERQRLALLEEAAALGAEYVDVELDAAGLCDTRGACRIISFHDFRGMPADLEVIHVRLRAAGADVAKVAVTARDICDNLPIFSLLRAAQKTSQPTIALAMGEHGQISRILGRKFGAFLTYAALEEGAGTAPGQITAARLRDEFRYYKINVHTDIYGVIARPVAHSLSPVIHNAAFEALGINAVYVPFLVEDVPRFLAEFRALGVKGYSVTIPHKEAALSAADEADDLAREIGAANTIVRRGDLLCATNTDCAGALAALEEALAGDELRGKSVILLGAGGAARAVAFGLRQRGARIVIVNRTFERGEELARDVGAEARHVEELPHLTADILINTTAVGMHPHTDISPVPREILRAGMVVFDAVYNPRETRLLREAKAAGCRVVYGDAWLLNQAALQFELWIGRPAPREVMARALRARLQS